MSSDQITGTPSGVVLSGTGTYSNPVTIVSDATVTGQPAVLAQDVRGIENDGTVTGTNTGIELKAGGSVTNIAGATITGYSIGIVGDTGGVPTDVFNDGVIGATAPLAFSYYPPSGFGIRLNAGGSISNGSEGTISGYNGISIRHAYGSIDNAGTIAAYSTGISMGSQGGSITNEVGGVISTSRHEAIYISGAGTVDNFGSISASFGYGVVLGGGGTIVNHEGASINAAYEAVQINNYPTNVDNAGSISGFWGVYFEYGSAGSTLTNEHTGSIFGIKYGVQMSDPGTVDNFGTIASGYYSGIRMRYGGTVINEAGGTITGGTEPTPGNYFTANASGVYFGGTDATLENAGTIVATRGDPSIPGQGDSVVMDGSDTNRLIVDAGAVFDGNVVARSGADNTLELAASATPGTITGLGTKYTGFETVTIDSGATWTVAGTIAGFNGSTIQGFDTSDRLDLTNLGYSADNTFSLSNSDVLTISENGTAIASIQLSGDFTGEFFHLTDDGNGGSYVTEDDNPVCYCRGTMVRTDRGEVAVEGLRIGDRVITASGQATPIRWIGRRSYSGKFARSNLNILPVCFKAGSLARNVPHRDLFVSPEHAMFIGGVLIPARHLVNGDSVFQASRTDLVEYFHIELDRHNVIVAEGALSETYADDDNRGRFHNAHEFRQLYPEHAKKRGALYCAPRVEDGYEVEQARIAIAARAVQLTRRTNRAAS
jgi:hypothetical protein